MSIRLKRGRFFMYFWISKKSIRLYRGRFFMNSEFYKKCPFASNDHVFSWILNFKKCPLASKEADFFMIFEFKKCQFTSNEVDFSWKRCPGCFRLSSAGVFFIGGPRIAGEHLHGESLRFNYFLLRRILFGT